MPEAWVSSTKWGDAMAGGGGGGAVTAITARVTPMAAIVTAATPTTSQAVFVRRLTRSPRFGSTLAALGRLEDLLDDPQVGRGILGRSGRGSAVEHSRSEALGLDRVRIGGLE